MKSFLLPIVVALIAQFGSLPMLIGVRSAGEAIGWPMIMAIFFGLPSAIVYLVMFGAFRLAPPPSWLAVILGVAIPAFVVLGFFKFRDVPIDLSPKNWVLWMGMIGGLAGTLAHLYLRPGPLIPA